MALLLGGDWEYESERVDYVMHRKYTPDFTQGDTHIEVKGFFRPGDQAKYKAIKEVLDEQGKKLVFIFSNPNKPVRKGAKLTHGKWCERNGIEYYSTASCKEGLLNRGIA